MRQFVITSISFMFIILNTVRKVSIRDAEETIYQKREGKNRAVCLSPLSCSACVSPPLTHFLDMITFVPVQRNGGHRFWRIKPCRSLSAFCQKASSLALFCAFRQSRNLAHTEPPRQSPEPDATAVVFISRRKPDPRFAASIIGNRPG